MSCRTAAGFFCSLLAMAQPPRGVDKTLIVDAVVTDASGHAVSDLKANDFTVLLDDRPQEITSCVYIDTQRDAGDSGAPLLVPRVRPAKGRRIVLVVDDLNLSVEGAAQVRRALQRFVNEQMQAGDSAVVVRTSAGNAAQQRFTSDPRSLQPVINLVQSRRLTDSATADSLFSAGTLGMVRVVLDGLLDVPGRKSVMFFTEAANASSGAGLDGLLEMANRVFAVVYVIDARGPGTAFTPSMLTSPALGDEHRQVPVLVASPPSEAPGSILAALAAQTGGMLLDHGDVSTELARALKDQDGYYLIQYRRDFAVTERRTGERVVENVSVKVRRDGVRARSRNGFPPSPDDWTLAAPATTSEKLVQALRSPFSSGEIRLNVSPIFYHSAKDGPSFILLLHIQARDMTFVKALNGLYKYGFDIGVMSFGDGGGPSEPRRSPLVTAALTEEQHQSAIRKGFTHEVRFPIERPGAYQVRVAVSDAMSGRVGTANQFVEAPDVSHGDLALSGINLLAGPDEDQGAVKLNAGDEVSFKYDIYNLSHGDNGQAEMESRVRLIHEGNLILDVGPTTIRFGPNPDPAHRTIKSHVPVDRELAPGDYTLQVIVTDTLAKGLQPRTATRHVFFEVTNQ